MTRIIIAAMVVLLAGCQTLDGITNSAKQGAETRARMEAGQAASNAVGKVFK